MNAMCGILDQGIEFLIGRLDTLAMVMVYEALRGRVGA